MLASGAHVKIGAFEFQLDETIDNQPGGGGSLFRPHYKRTVTNLFSDRTPLLVGDPSSNEVRPERLLWSMTDWGGGENNRTYQPTDPFVYDFGYGVNGRVRGQITGRPSRVANYTSFTTNDVTLRPSMTVSQGALWYGGGYRVGYTNTDVSTWQILDSTGVDGTDFAGLQHISTTYEVTAMAGDSEYCYYTAYDRTAKTRIIKAKTKDNSNKAGIVENSGTVPHAGLAVLHGRLYGWTGRKLFAYDTAQLTGNTPTALAAQYIVKKGDTGIDPANTNALGSAWYGGIVAAENSLFMYYTTDNQSTVYEHAVDGGMAPVWTPPIGANIKAMTYSNGVVYFSGHWGGDLTKAGRGFLYAMPLDTRRPVFVTYIRKQNNLNLQMKSMAPSYGSTILLAAVHQGRIFVYDADMDSLSCLDDIGVTAGTDNNNSNGTEAAAPRIPNTDAPASGVTFKTNSDCIGSMITFGQTRNILIYSPDNNTGWSTYRMLSYQDEEPLNRQAGTATNSAVTKLEIGDYDYNMPFDQKALLGFDVLFAPLTTGQSFTLEYSTDGAAYVSAGTVTSASADAAKGRTYVTVSTGSSTVKFGRMRYRITLTGTSTNLPPILYNVTVEGALLAYDEIWELRLKVKDEDNRARPGGRKVDGAKIRDWLFTAQNNHSVVTFLDGYYYKQPGQYKTNTVVIDQIEDYIIRIAEGTLYIKLRSVPV